MSGRFVSTLVAGAGAAVVALTGMPAASAAADTTPPVLHSVSFSTSATSPGSPVTLTVDATDDVAVSRVIVRLYEETSGYEVKDDFPSGSAISFTPTSAWADGTYRIFDVSLFDAAGNYASYHRSGSLFTRPASTTTHTVDLQSQGVTLTGASDLTPPVLKAFAVQDPATRAGEVTSLTFTVTDAESAVASMHTAWSNDETGEIGGSGTATDPPSSGTLDVTMPQAGHWRLVGVWVADSRGNTDVYTADGSIQGPWITRGHDLDLASTSVELAPGAQALTVVPRPGRLTVLHEGRSTDPKVLTGYRVTVQPAGVSLDLGADAWATGSLDVPHLPNGVTQTVTLVAHSGSGDSPVATTTGRPVLSGNVTGIADVTGDGRPDVVAQREYGLGQDAAVLSYPGTGTGGLRAPSTYLRGSQGGCEQLGAGDVYILGNGEPLCQHDDLVAIWRGGGGEVLGTRGWRAMRWVDGGYSLNADRYPDVIAMNAKGELLLYPRSSTDRLLAPVRIGTGWNTMISVISAGDLNGDRRNDIVAADAAGRLWLYPGNGKGGVTARRQIGSGWQNMAALLPLRDLSGDGRADLGGITPGGDLRLYRGTGTGTVRAGVVIGTGWQRYL